MHINLFRSFLGFILFCSYFSVPPLGLFSIPLLHLARDLWIRSSSQSVVCTLHRNMSSSGATIKFPQQKVDLWLCVQGISNVCGGRRWPNSPSFITLRRQTPDEELRLGYSGQLLKKVPSSSFAKWFVEEKYRGNWGEKREVKEISIQMHIHYTLFRVRFLLFLTN